MKKLTEPTKKIEEMTFSEAIAKIWELASIMGKYGFDKDMYNAIINIANTWNDSIGFYARNKICIYDLDADWCRDLCEDGETREGIMINDESITWQV